MNFANTRWLSTLWVGAFISAFFLHIALGARFYFQNSNVSNKGTISPVVMLTFAQEIVRSDVDTDSLDVDTDLSDINPDLEVLQSDFSEQKPEILESMDEVEQEDSQYTVEKSDFTVPKPLKKSLPKKIENKALVKKQLPKSKTTMEQLDTKAIHSSTDSYGSNAAALERALLEKWLEKVQTQLERQKKYVVGRRTSRAKGTVQLEFKVHEQGNIFSSRVVLSAGDQELDRLAIAALQRVGAFPPPPPSKVNKIIRVSLIFS
ncbi:energy transducer TonB family protein [Bartonella sp. B35(2025)]